MITLALCGATPIVSPARADDDPAVKDGVRASSFATNFAGNADWGGHRKTLSELGITYQFIYTSEMLRNLAGGLKRGGLFEGKLDMQLTVDLEKFAGLSGWTFYSNIFQLHRTGGPRRHLTGSVITVSNIEALPTTRLSELWLEKKFMNDQMSLRFGQLATDQEFFIASTSDMFLAADWPAITASNLPGGGPAFPLSTPGMRLKYEPWKGVTFLTAILNGSPSAPDAPSAENNNRHGLNFRLKDPPLWLGEAQYRFNQDAGLAGTIRVGGWNHFGKFNALRFGTDLLSLGSPFSNGIPLRYRGESGIYATFDQQIWRPQGGGPDSGVSIFGRVSKAMPANRSVIDFYADGGILFSGLVPGRPDDKFGIYAIIAHFSKHLRRLDADVLALQGIAQPRHSAETTLELNYNAQITTGWMLQPMVQFIRRPGGGVALPSDPTGTQRIRDAKVVGMRSLIFW